MRRSFLILSAKSSVSYELIDFGDGEKLERFAEYTVRRPDPQALGKKRLSCKEWDGAHFSFVHSGTNGSWHFAANASQNWELKYEGLKFLLRPSAFKHIGIFPEQAPQWDFIRLQIQNLQKTTNRKRFSVLNLFGYTGAATLAAAFVGAEVCHVDGSAVAIKWAKENAMRSGLQSKPIRWIEDDAATFVAREIRRKKLYDGIILDPPAFGHGPKRELWKIEKNLVPLLEQCGRILSEDASFVVLNGYAAGYGAHAYANILPILTNGRSGIYECGEMVIEERESKRVLPAGIFARWAR